MKRASYFSIVILALFFMIGCAAQSQKQHQPATSSQDPIVQQRPEWVMNEPEVEGNDLYFVGISAVHATEKNARNDARRDATNSVVQYLGTLAKTKYEQATVSYGLSSQVVDPTTASRQFEKQVAANVATRMKTTKWYMERETDSIGKKGYKYFTLAKIPKDSLNEAFQNTAEQNMKDAQERAAKAATAQAKKQAEDQAKFWTDMKQQGVVE